MRKKVYCSLLMGGLALAAFATLLQRKGEFEASLLQLRARSMSGQGQSEWRSIAAVAKERAWLYEQAIERDHLLKSMVVNRYLADGKAESVCDSLMFSSLRFVALQKLGADAEADQAFTGIVEQAYQNGRWLRHPDCKRKASSRDMIVGLMAALTQEPKGHEIQFARLMEIIDRTGGSVDDGPFYVSRLSPGMGELLKNMAIVRGWPDAKMPTSVRVGFATLELDAWMAKPGFRSHLNAMMLWIELELLARHPELEFRSISNLVDHISPDLGSTFAAQRRAFAARSLYTLDPDNLFFEYLNLRTAGALTYSAKTRLLEKLLAMPQFPVERLPQDCDRRADYLWQRSSVEYQPKKVCGETFHGVDFLWMAALLTEDDISPKLSVNR